MSAPNRSLHCLACQLDGESTEFEPSAMAEVLNKDTSPSNNNHVGFRVAARGIFEGFRPKVFAGRSYTVKVIETNRGKSNVIEGLKIDETETEFVTVSM